jgi:hypothetical protein
MAVFMSSNKTLGPTLLDPLDGSTLSSERNLLNVKEPNRLYNIVLPDDGKKTSLRNLGFLNQMRKTKSVNTRMAVTNLQSSFM